jgi:exo-beta-1,3-glucanase (GH17 family)
LKIVSKFLAAGLVMLAVGETCTYAERGIIGVNYGPYHKKDQTPERPDDDPIKDDQFQKDLSEIVLKFGYIRTYGTEKRVQGLVPFIAKNFPDLNVYLGIFESTKWHDATEAQMDKAIELAKNYPKIVEYIIVGNECLDQDWKDSTQSVSIEQLIADINKVKQSVPANVKVTTCLGFHSALNPEKLEDGSPNGMYNKPGNMPAHGTLDYGKRIMKESKADSLMFTVYPFYGKVPVEKAKDNTKYWYDYAVKNIANGKPVILGEVGWPSTADPGQTLESGEAVPSVANEQKYITDMINAAKDGQVGSIFLFEAFDEPWKPGKERGGNQWEKHWGLWDDKGNPKFAIPSGM